MTSLFKSLVYTGGRCYLCFEEKSTRRRTGLPDEFSLVACWQSFDRRLQPSCRRLIRAHELREQPTWGICAGVSRPGAREMLRIPRRDVERDTGVDRVAAAQEHVDVPVLVRPLPGRVRPGRWSRHRPILGRSRGTVTRRLEVNGIVAGKVRKWRGQLLHVDLDKLRNALAHVRQQVTAYRGHSSLNRGELDGGEFGFASASFADALPVSPNLCVTFAAIPLRTSML